MDTLPITLEALQVLDAIERRGSFAAAAEELNKATSALSYTVQKLEEQLGVTLFQRSGRRSVLTQSGRLVLEEGRKILAATAFLTDQVRELETGWEPRLRIGLESIAERELFFHALATLLQDQPYLELDVQECVMNGAWEALETDAVDLLVGAPSPVPQRRGIRAIALPPAGMMLVAAADHPAAELSKDPDSLTQRLSYFRRVVTHDTAQRQVVRTEGLRLGRQVIYVQTIDQKLQAILSGIGVSHLPAHIAQPLIEEGRLVHLQGKEPTTENGRRNIAWKISNKGRALKQLTEILEQRLVPCQ